MNPPKMPVHIGDYKRDTGHLRAAGHGAYLMLLFHYWSTGSLPDDDEQLAAIACMTKSEWKKTRPVIEKFFKPGWKHGRVEEDLEAAKQSYEKRAKAGEKGGKAKATSKQSSSNATAGPEQPLTFNHTNQKETEANASGAEAPPDPSEPERQFFKRGREILGKSSGGQLAKLLKVAGNVALARSKIELASTKDNPAEFIAKVITAAGTGPPAKPLTQHQIERQESREILNDLQKFIDDSSGRGSDADPGILRFDPGDGQKSVHGGPGRDLVDLSARRGREGG